MAVPLRMLLSDALTRNRDGVYPVLLLPLRLAGMDFVATKGNHDANCDEGQGDAEGCKLNNNRCDKIITPAPSL
eukprot:265336-Prorocentrum_minimum.AAC.12